MYGAARSFHLDDDSIKCVHGFREPIGTEEEKVHVARFPHEQPQQIQGSRVGPLQVIQKEHERVLFSRHRPDECAQDVMDAILRLGGGELLDGRLGPDDQFELRKDIHHHLSVLAEELQ